MSLTYRKEKIYLSSLEERVLKNEFISVYFWNKKKVEYILTSNSKYSELISFIFIVEKMNRGNILYFMSEKFFTFTFPKLLLKYDFSVGLFQIKPSFLNVYAEYVNLNKLYNLDYCISVLDNFLKSTDYLDVSQQISLYHSGEINSEVESTKIYIYLHEWFTNYFKF